MTIDEILAQVASSDYDFLRSDKNLGNRIVFLAVSGSYAYGTNTEQSDLDIRGCALSSRMQILTGNDFDHVENSHTDTMVYSFLKMVSLLRNCNPNVIELLGCKPEHYLYLSDVGQEILDNVHLFLSKRAVRSFGGYITSKLKSLGVCSHVGKQMAHIVRLYATCLDILEQEKVVTYREKEHDLLMDLRNGKYLDSIGRPVRAFYDMVEDFESRFAYASANTCLPADPDYNRINEFVAGVNERVVLGKIEGCI